MTHRDTEKVPKHARRIAKNAQGTARSTLPLDRHLCNLATQRHDTADQLHVKRKARDFLALEHGAHYVHAEQLESALRIVNAAHSDTPHEEMEQA